MKLVTIVLVTFFFTAVALAAETTVTNDFVSENSAFAERYDIKIGTVSGRIVSGGVNGTLQKVCGDCDENGKRTCKYVIVQDGCAIKPKKKVKKCLLKKGVKVSNCPVVRCPTDCDVIKIVKENKCKVCTCDKTQ